jgi:sulfur carrier protein
MPLYDARGGVRTNWGYCAFMPCRMLQGRIRHHTETQVRIEVVIELVINGEARSFPAPLTLAQLVETLDLAGKRIAIEKNGEIVPRSQHASTPLASGDRLEIVVAVGGG